MLLHNTIVSFPNSVSTMSYTNIKSTHRFFTLPPLHFNEHSMNLQSNHNNKINTKFQLIHPQVHSFEARLILVLKPNILLCPKRFKEKAKSIDHIRILSIGLELACNGG